MFFFWKVVHDGVKGNKPRERVKILRLINPLNTDDKLLSGVLAARMKPVLNNVIRGDQKGFLKNRCISENCRLVLVSYNVGNRKENEPGMPLPIF